MSPIAVSRRDALISGGVSALAMSFAQARLATGPTREKLPVAAIATVYTRSSHADVILGKILDGFRQDGGAGPDLRLVSLFLDQYPETDLARNLARQRGFRLAESIDDALTGGTDGIQVAGVLCIGEHGDYPLTPDTLQRMYPRKRFFDAVVNSFQRCRRSVPVFNDKHLSYRWGEALEMVETSRKLGFPLLAGSSLPVAWRIPAIELPRDCEIESAVTIGYGGLEDYGFHALEAHQCLLERRRGGETGIAAVRTVSGAEIQRVGREGAWSSELFAAARQAMPGAPQDAAEWQPGPDAAVYLLEHRDGLRSAIVMANGLAGQFACAIKLRGRTDPIAIWFKLQEGPPFGHFAYLLRAIEYTIHNHKTAYPVERTLLTSGILDRVMQSRAAMGRRLETPELAISYKAQDWPFANHLESPLQLPND